MFEGILFILYSVLATMLVVLAVALRRAFRTFRMQTKITPSAVVEDMPSVSVLIPARNESHVMPDCLQRVINSNYPKLEIIVLDDSSRDKTSSLIKAFAHDGVRFVEGKALPDGWLGKNHALNELLKEASGTYALFIDVDTRVEPDTVEQLVAYAEDEHASMVSVLPRRDDGIRASTLFAPLRYFWQLIFHRQESPAVASSAWMVHRKKFIDEYKDFSAMKDVIQPEAAVAATFMSKGLYRFLIGTTQLGVSYQKKWASQRDTSVRLLFPLVGGRIAAGLLAVFDLFIVASPLFIMLSGFVTGWTVHHWIAASIYAGYALLYASYLRKVWRRGWAFGALFWGIVAIQEAFLVLTSMIGYKMNRVMWKGRLVRLAKR